MEIIINIIFKKFIINVVQNFKLNNKLFVKNNNDGMVKIKFEIIQNRKTPITVAIA